MIMLLGGSFLFFQLVLPYHLYFKEQLKLFLFTSGHFLSYFAKPAWLASYTGDFLTQLFYLKGGGAAVVALILVIEWLLVKRLIAVFGNKTYGALWALIPVAADWIFFANFGYTVSLPVAFIIVISIFLIYARIKNRWISMATGILLVPFLYWTVGAGALFFALMLILFDIRKKRYRAWYWVVLLLEAVAIPVLLRSTYLLTLTQSFLYPYLGTKELASFIILIVILILMQLRGIREMPRRMIPFVASILLPIAVLLTGIFINTNFNREKVLALSTEYYFGNTDKVIELAERYQLSSPLATYYTNLALSRKGLLGERLLDFYQPFHLGLFLPVNERSDWFTIFFSNEVFYHVGDMNLATHSAMLGIIFSPFNQSGRLLVRLAEINLANNDTEAADKYRGILEKTWFYGRHIHTPEHKQSQLATRDIIRQADDYPASLNLLLESNPENAEALDYLLCFYLLNKDIKSFKAAYDKYFTQGATPSVYQQGLLIYFAIEGAKKNELQRYKIENRMVEYFNNYTKLYEETEGNIEAMQQDFGKTYWFYYHYATMK